MVGVARAAFQSPLCSQLRCDAFFRGWRGGRKRHGIRLRAGEVGDSSADPAAAVALVRVASLLYLGAMGMTRHQKPQPAWKHSVTHHDA
jgi:hypothetical protein